MHNKEDKKDKITIRRLIGNVVYMIRYAAKYDKPLIMRIIILNVLLLSGMAVNDTFILKLIINGLTGKAEFSDIVGILLISLVLVMCLEWIQQLLNEWAKAKLIRLSGRIQRDLIERNSLKDLIYYDDPDNFDNYVLVANNSDYLIEQTVMIVSKILGGAIALLIAAAMILTINPVLAIFPVCGFIVNLMTRFKIEKIHFEWFKEYKIALRKADYSKRVFYQPEYAKECKLTDVKGPLRRQFDEAVVEAADAQRLMVAVVGGISDVAVP